VVVNTNHLERALRAIPMGRRNWLLRWIKLGAKHVGIVQSLIVTCRLHQINPYDYLGDVLQRMDEHPAARVAERTPRLWKRHFAPNPLRLALHDLSSYDKNVGWLPLTSLLVCDSAQTARATSIICNNSKE